MKKIVFLLILLTGFISASAQWGRPNTRYGDRMYRTANDSTFYFPTGCGTPSGETGLRLGTGTNLNMGAIYFDSCASKVWFYDPKLKTWIAAAADFDPTLIYAYIDSVGQKTVFAYNRAGDSLTLSTSDGTAYTVYAPLPGTFRDSLVVYGTGSTTVTKIPDADTSDGRHDTLIISTPPIITSGNACNYLNGVAGIQVLDSLKIAVTVPQYYINCKPYDPIGDSLQLPDADPTHPFNVNIIVDTFNVLSYEAGTPSATPPIVGVDDTYQLLIGTITIPAGATEIPHVNSIIYDEGTESDTTKQGGFANTNFRYPVNPYSGLYSVKTGAYIPGSITFVLPDDLYSGDYESLGFGFKIASLSQPLNANGLQIMFMNDGQYVGRAVPIKPYPQAGNYGLKNDTAWHPVVVPMGQFGGGFIFDSYRIFSAYSNSAGFSVDKIVLQKNGITVPTVDPDFAIVETDSGTVFASKRGDRIKIFGEGTNTTAYHNGAVYVKGTGGGTGRTNSVRGQYPILIDSSDVLNPIVKFDTLALPSVGDTTGFYTPSLDSTGQVEFRPVYPTAQRKLTNSPKLTFDTTGTLKIGWPGTTPASGTNRLMVNGSSYLSGKIGVGASPNSAMVTIDGASVPTYMWEVRKYGTLYSHQVVDTVAKVYGVGLLNNTYLALQNVEGNQNPQLRMFSVPSTNSATVIAYDNSSPTTKHSLNLAASGTVTVNPTNNDNINLIGTGNVGIGTISPAASLPNGATNPSKVVEINSASNVKDAVITLMSNTPLVAADMWLDRSSGQLNIDNRYSLGDVVIRTDATTTPMNALVVKAAGNIGVGSVSPSSKLTVSGNSSIGSGYTGTAAPTNGAIIEGSLGVGTSAPHASAMLDVATTTKGVRFSPMTATQRNAISTPAQMLMVGNTDTRTYSWYSGASWYDVGLMRNAANSALISPFSGLGGTGSTFSIFIGDSAGSRSTSPVGNTGIGANAIRNNTTGVNLTAVGFQALLFNTASDNSAFGHSALYNNTTGSCNTAIGYRVLYSNTTGQNNTGVGRFALSVNTTGSNNSSVGYGSLSSVTTGGDNTAFGYIAGGSNVGGAGTTGSRSSYFGNQSGSDGYLLTADPSNDNSAFGYQSRSGTSGSGNTVMGVSTMVGDSASNGNIAIGVRSFSGAKQSNKNIIIGDTLLGKPMATATPYQIQNSLYIGGGLRSGDTISSNKMVIGLQDGWAGISMTGKSSWLMNGTNTNLPSFTASAALEVKSTTGGFLPPAMTTSNRTGISSPADGIQVYDTDLKLLYFYHSGSSSWMPVNSFVTNATTSGLSSSTLNSTYPNVPVGFRVICGSITLGGAIYTKYTEAGSSDVWLMSSAPVQM